MPCPGPPRNTAQRGAIAPCTAGAGPWRSSASPPSRWPCGGVLAPGGASTQDAAPSASGAVGQPGTRLVAKRLPVPLQAPVSGEAVAPDGKRLLVLGGLDAAGASASGVFSVDPGTGRLLRAGSLAQPVHDAAAATLGGTAYLFGGGDTSSTTAVQAIDAGGTARVVGHLPAPRSDLVAATVGGQIYLIGGYDGRTLSAAVLRTRDGRTFSTAARLPDPGPLPGRRCRRRKRSTSSEARRPTVSPHERSR